MIKFINVPILLLFSLCILGCGTVATKGNLPEIATPLDSKICRSLTYRSYIDIKAPESHWLKADDVFSDQMKNALTNSDLFSKIEEYKITIPNVQLQGKNTLSELEIATQINFPIETDYFLDIKSQVKFRSGELYMYWGLFHVISLGFIPIAINNDVNLIITLYDKQGIKLYNDSITDTSTIWAWTPLLLFNGGKHFRHLNNIAGPIREKALLNVLSKISQLLHKEASVNKPVTTYNGILKSR